MTVRISAKKKIQILNSQHVYEIMREILMRENLIRRNQEHFWVIGLNNQNKILFIELITLGAKNRLIVDPPEVFRMAIYKMAVRVIFAHNHPGGIKNISEADKDTTDRMLKAGAMLRIEVTDHLVITETEFTSFADEGIMEELKHSGKYELIDGRLKEQFIEMQVEAGKDKERRGIAKRMKAEGVDVAVIQKFTKLRKSEIQKL
ncbi:MAG: JAB domain-containing protein [Bacteroidota bacterium]